MNLEQRQFNRLLRGFSSRLFDNEILAPGGESRQGAVHVLALLAVALLAFLRYRRRREERLDAGVMYEERSDWWLTRIELQP